MEMEITTSDRIFNNYIDYFNGLEPNWKSNPSQLLKVLLKSNSIKAIKFLMDNAEKINEIFPSAEVYSEDIIKELSEYIGYNNRIDLIEPERLINMYQTNKYNNINLKNYIVGITLLGRKRKEEIEIEKEVKKLRII